MTLKESYDRVEGKLVKDNSEYKHYTSIENFHKIVKSGFIKGGEYPANTYNYGKGYKGGEVCLVRSNMSPDNTPNTKLSAEIGDIKFTFKRDTIEPKFGKVKPIDEYPVQGKYYANNIVKYIKQETTFQPPKLIKVLQEIRTKGWRFTDEETERVLKVLNLCCSKDTYAKAKHDLDYIKSQWNSKEKMESRIRAEKVDLKYVEKIMIPTYLQNNQEIKKDIEILKSKGITNISFYECKYPREGK